MKLIHPASSKSFQDYKAIWAYTDVRMSRKTLILARENELQSEEIEELLHLPDSCLLKIHCIERTKIRKPKELESFLSSKFK